MPKTISFHNGSDWSRGHNIRDERFIKEQAHIDTSLSDNNIVLVDEPVKKAYDRIFGEAVKRYNAKQKRADRRIDSYYNKIKQDKRKHIVYECIVQIGDKDDTGNNAPLEKEALKRFAENWEQRNPNLKLIGAYIHSDEPDGTVHMHIDYIPAAECSRGMRLQNSLDRALEQQGFQTQNIKHTAQMAWQERERKALIEICQALKIDVYKSPHGVFTDGREHLSKSEYQQIKEKAKQQMEWELKEYQPIIDNLLSAEPQNAIEGIPVPPAAKFLIGKENKDKLLYSPADVENIKKLAKATAVISAKNQQENANLYNKWIHISELDDKAARAVTAAMQKELQAEQTLNAAADKAAEIKREADEIRLEADKYASDMRAFYAERFPYVQQLIEDKKQIRVEAEEKSAAEIEALRKELDIKQKTIESDNHLIAYLKKNQRIDNEYISDQRKQIKELDGKVRSLYTKLDDTEKEKNLLIKKVKTLESENTEKASQISSIGQELETVTNNYDLLQSMYNTACEVGKYIANKIKLDFMEILNKRLDGYRLSYIIDEGHNRGAR